MAIGLLPVVTWQNGTVVTSSYLQTVQDDINALIQGQLPLQGLVSGTTTPTPAFTRNILYGDLLPLAWGKFGSGPGFIRGVNIASYVRNSAGNYTITLNTAASSANDLAIVAVPVNASASVFTAQTSITTSSVFTILTFVGGVATDPSTVAFWCFGV